MTIVDVAIRSAYIKSLDDIEARHEAEDSLAWDVIRAIADGCEDARVLAIAAMEAYDPDAERWYA